jgi:hypothetical protein
LDPAHFMVSIALFLLPFTLGEPIRFGSTFERRQAPTSVRWGWIWNGWSSGR